MAFIFSPPVGVVLAILRSISIPLNKKSGGTQERSEAKNSFDTSKHTNNGRRRGRSKVKNTSTETKVTRVLSIATGCLGVFLMLLLGLDIFSYSWSFWQFVRQFLMLALPFGTASLGFGIASKAFANRDTRYGRIRAIIGNRESINLTKLATASNEKIKNVRKDVQQMIDNGEFGEYAYIDLGTNNFMRSPYAEPDEPEVFDFRKAYGDVLKKDKKEDNRSSDEAPAENTSGDEDNGDFEKIISEIRRLNDEIADIPVSERIDRIEEHTKNIFEYVTDHPEAMPQIRTFMNYYLPTTLKLLESYSRIERVGVAGENMKQSKEKIENILDLLVVGFEQQVDQLFKNESIDISSDIIVLEKMMQKDGLSGKNDFDTSRFNEYTDELSDLSGAAAMQSDPKSNTDTTLQ